LSKTADGSSVLSSEDTIGDGEDDDEDDEEDNGPANPLRRVRPRTTTVPLRLSRLRKTTTQAVAPGDGDDPPLCVLNGEVEDDEQDHDEEAE
jgi:hypothetical protein